MPTSTPLFRIIRSSVRLSLGLSFAIIFGLALSNATQAQADDASPPGARASDVESLDSILKALYDTISGPKGERDWERFRHLFAPDARLIPCVTTQDGLKRSRTLSVDQFTEIAKRSSTQEPFYENEVDRHTETYGAIAHVFSRYESRRDPKGEPFAKGMNSIQLLNDGKRWHVVTIYWDQERTDEAPQANVENTNASQRPLEIFFIDVMGGAATLIVTPEGESILVDSGWPGFEDRDPKRIEHVLKNVAKLDRIDHLLTTHWHTDHYGGVKGLSERVRIDHYWDRGLPNPGESDSPKPDSPLMSAYLKASEGKRQTLTANDQLRLKGETRLEMLASSGQVRTAGKLPPNPLADQAPGEQDRDPSDNARSLAFKLTYGKFGFVDCGDLTWNIERKLVVPADLIGQADLYQVTHHGMSISNYPTLIETIRPLVAITNNGPRKGGAPETLERLRDVKSIQAIYQLHRNQATTAKENVDPEWIANQDPQGGQFIRVTVSPDGSRFQVRIGADGPAKTFECVD